MEDKENLKEIVSRCEKIGFKSKPKDDFEGLTELFNESVEEMYDAILFYLDEDTLNVIYPIVHDYLSRVLVVSLVKETKIDKFKQIFHIEAEKILAQTFKEHSIDVFDQKYILSSLNLDDISKFMVNNFICSVIADNFNKENAKLRRNFICNAFNISRLQYKKRLSNIGTELNRLFKEEDNKYILNK